MDAGLEFVTLPLDAPDDDPRWAGWKAQTDLGFLEPSGDADVGRMRDDARAEGWRMGGVMDPASLLPDTPVATFTSVDKRLNVGAGRLVTADLISDVTVRASHRRQGILRELMTRDLTAARDRGCALALLTASEGGIYGRFGFGVSTRGTRVQIDARRFQLRRPAVGRCEYARPADLGEHYDRLVAAHVARDRGAFERWPFHRALVLGEWDWETHGPNQKLYGVVHRAEDGEIDGLVTYQPVADSDPGRIDVHQMIAASAEVELALWAFLASLDLVDLLDCKRLRVDDPLPLGLVNPRAVKVTSVYDLLWVRVLHAERALGERGWDRDGDLVLRVDDPMGFVDGTYAITVRDGRASVARTEATAQATVDAETLGQLYLAGIAPSALAAAGRIAGDAESVVRLFSVLTPPWAPVGF